MDVSFSLGSMSYNIYTPFSLPGSKQILKFVFKNFRMFGLMSVPGSW